MQCQLWRQVFNHFYKDAYPSATDEELQIVMHRKFQLDASQEGPNLMTSNTHFHSHRQLHEDTTSELIDESIRMSLATTGELSRRALLEGAATVKALRQDWEPSLNLCTHRRALEEICMVLEPKPHMVDTLPTVVLSDPAVGAGSTVGMSLFYLFIHNSTILTNSCCDNRFQIYLLVSTTWS